MDGNRELPIEGAIDFLKPRLREIDRVNEWARAMGYKNSKRFSRLFRNHFKKQPKKILDEIKVQKAIELLTNGNEMSCYEVAWEIGKRDEQALYKFMIRKTGYHPSYFLDSKKG
jgi:transcriptional regulator GlxA family with amidase domain